MCVCVGGGGVQAQLKKKSSDNVDFFSLNLFYSGCPMVISKKTIISRGSNYFRGGAPPPGPPPPPAGSAHEVCLYVGGVKNSPLDG